MPKALTDKEFKQCIYRITNNLTILGEYKSCKKPILVQCKKCNHTWRPLPDNLKKGQVGCPLCLGMVAVKGVNSFFDTNHEQSLLLKNIEDSYTNLRYSKKVVQWICPKCNNIINRSFERVTESGICCSRCSDGISFPNKVAYNVLEMLSVNFITEYSPNWIKPKRYDFYFEHNNQKYILEMDGSWHKKDNKLSGQTKEESKRIDEYKDKMANNHNIIVIRVDCGNAEFNYIKENIINSNLSSIFDLSIIEWGQCLINSSKSCKLLACDLWNGGMRDTTIIALHLKLHRATIVRYLTSLAKYGLCDYNPKESLINSNKGKSPSNCRKVICITTNEIFNSISDAQKKYKCDNISACCQGKRNFAGILPDGTRLMWKYYNEEQKLNDGFAKEVLQLNTKLEVINRYNSLREAEKITNINRKCISRCCKGKQRIAGGYIWKFASELQTIDRM